MVPLLGAAAIQGGAQIASGIMGGKGADKAARYQYQAQQDALTWAKAQDKLDRQEWEKQFQLAQQNQAFTQAQAQAQLAAREPFRQAALTVLAKYAPQVADQYSAPATISVPPLNAPDFAADNLGHESDAFQASPGVLSPPVLSLADLMAPRRQGGY